MAFYGTRFALLLVLCAGQTTSPTTSPSPTPTPCAAPPGYFCSGGSALLCPIGAFCAGGAALNVSCYPVTACTVAGLSAQPPCYWKVSTLAGSGVLGHANGQGTNARFNGPHGISVDPNSSDVYVGENSGNYVRKVSASGFVSTAAGTGSASYGDGPATSAMFKAPHGLPVDPYGSVFIADHANNRVRKLASGIVTTVAGSGAASSIDGIGLAATFKQPTSIALIANGTIGYVVEHSGSKIRALNLFSAAVATLAGSGSISYTNGVGTAASFCQPTAAIYHASGLLFVADLYNNLIRTIDTTSRSVTTLAGTYAGCTATTGTADGTGTSASFNSPRGLTLDSRGAVLYVMEDSGNVLRAIQLSTSYVSTIAGSGVAGTLNGYGRLAQFNRGLCLSSYLSTGVLVTAEFASNNVRQISCVPCPVGYFCPSFDPASSPVVCPAGSSCPLSSINATLCPKGSFSSAGASNCSLCPAGTYTSATGSTSCQQCPGGHYCPAGTSSWARLNCGKGNYCPDGAAAPKPCPYQVPPFGGWGALQVQGPAFLVETALCLNHCFWNFTSGDGVLSKC